MKRRSYTHEVWCRVTRTLRPALFMCLCLLISGCSDDDTSGPSPAEEQPCVPGAQYDYYRMEFGLDYRNGGTLTFTSTCDTLEGTLTVREGNPLITGGVPYTGNGMLYRFPETGDSLYTLKFPGSAVQDGTCGGREISLSLSLSAKKGSPYSVGGLTAYCGRDVFYGRPARVMRISGTIDQTVK